MDWLRKLDAHPKTLDEFRVRTLQGGLTTLLAAIVSTWLIGTELQYSLGVYTRDRLYVNSSHGAAISVAFEIEFPRVSCDLVSVAVTDQSGQPISAPQHVRKLKLFANGRRFHSRSALGETATSEEHFVSGNASKDTGCGDCYGAQDDEIQCCQTCDDVKRAYAKRGWTFVPKSIMQCAGENAVSNIQEQDEGCAIAGDLVLSAVSGNFHFAPGRHIADARHMLLTDIVALAYAKFNVSHVIKRLEFSQHKILSTHMLIEDEDDDDDDDYKSAKRRRQTRIQRREMRKRRRLARRATASSQLAGARRIITDGYGMHQYYLKVVPSYYRSLDGHITPAAKYSVTEHLRHVAPGSGRGLPGLFFYYEVSPVCFEVTETRDGFLAFFVGLAAIIGGVYVTFGQLDRALAFASHTILRSATATKHRAGAAGIPT